MMNLVPGVWWFSSVELCISIDLPVYRKRIVPFYKRKRRKNLFLSNRIISDEVVSGASANDVTETLEIYLDW